MYFSLDETPLFKWDYEEQTLPPEETVKIAKKVSGTRRNYSVFTYNCEHFATECKTGRSSSAQVANAAKTAGGSAILVSALAASAIMASKRG